MEDTLKAIFILAVLGMNFGFVGRLLARRKRRSPMVGFWLGALLGPLGILVVVSLPARPAWEPSDGSGAKLPGAKSAGGKSAIEGWDDEWPA